MRILLVCALAILVTALVGGNVAESVSGTSGRIAFDSGSIEEDGQGVYTAASDGSGITRLSPDFYQLDGQPVYSPDGSRIAFHGVKDVAHPQIYVMNADGSNLVRVTNGPGVDASASWSPDGARLVYDSERNGNIDIYVINVDGTGETRLTTGSDVEAFPAFSPDGTKIAFQSNRTGNYDIFVMNADGSGQTNLTNSPSDEALPDWSPSGRKLAIARDSGSNNIDVYTMNAEGGAQTRLTTAGGYDSSPEWSPDGAKIIFSSSRSGDGDIWQMNANGSDQKKLAGRPQPDDFPDWSPPTCSVATVIDGDTFTCTDGTTVDMLQLDAPELGACGGEWAQAALANIFLTPGRTVALSYDEVTASGNTLAAPIIRGTDGIAYNMSIVMVYVGLAKAAIVGAGNSKYLNWANGSQGWAAAAQWNMWAPGKPFVGGC